MDVHVSWIQIPAPDSHQYNFFVWYINFLDLVELKCRMSSGLSTSDVAIGHRNRCSLILSYHFVVNYGFWQWKVLCESLVWFKYLLNSNQNVRTTNNCWWVSDSLALRTFSCLFKYSLASSLNTVLVKTSASFRFQSQSKGLYFVLDADEEMSHCKRSTHCPHLTNPFAHLSKWSISKVFFNLAIWTVSTRSVIITTGIEHFPDVYLVLVYMLNSSVFERRVENEIPTEPMEERCFDNTKDCEQAHVKLYDKAARHT